MKKYSLKQLDVVAYVLSVVVLLLVGLMRRVKIPMDIDFGFLPPLHATLNAITAIILLYALIQIRKKNIEAHKKAIFTAMITSGLFLLSYVVYHFTTVETKFCQEGTIRYVYFFFLITHIVLAAVSLPFILLTFNRGFTMSIEKHRRMARWVWPVWFYVALTGPICYLMLKPCYG